jgi:hypothetical protein
MESDAERLVEVRGLPLLPPLLWPKRDSITAKKQPFWIKNRAFRAENGAKNGVCSYQSVNRYKISTYLFFVSYKRLMG